MRPVWPICSLIVALWLVTPALGAAPSAVDAANGPEIDNPLDVTRHAMPPPDITAKPPTASTGSANPLWAIPLSALTATRSRPLFTPSRRPPAPIVVAAPVAAPPPPPPPPPAPEHPNLMLVGTVAGEGGSVAVFIDNATRNAVRLRTGESHGGWVLQVVDHRTVTLQKGSQTETLELPKPTDTKGPTPVITTLPPGPMRPQMPPPRPPSPPAAHPAPPTPANPPQRQGCMPPPIGC